MQYLVLLLVIVPFSILGSFGLFQYYTEFFVGFFKFPALTFGQYYFAMMGLILAFPKFLKDDEELDVGEKISYIIARVVLVWIFWGLYCWLVR